MPISNWPELVVFRLIFQTVRFHLFCKFKMNFISQTHIRLLLQAKYSQANRLASHFSGILMILILARTDESKFQADTHECRSPLTHYTKSCT